MVLVSLLLIATLAPAATQPIYGIARAGDGDSLDVNGTRIRLYGIDAPEFDQICNHGGAKWACGSEAADRLSRLVTGREVRCVPNGRDQYDRVLARCSVGPTDVNAAMVEQGFAVAFRRYSTDYVAAESRARNAKRGIWAGTFTMPGTVRASAGPSRPDRSTVQPRARVEPQPFAGGCVIKGNQSRRGDWIYHVPGMPYYAQTRAEAMFCSEREAQAAGYRRAKVR